MPIYDKAFYGIGFFLLGVLGASMVQEFEGRMVYAVLVTAFFVVVFVLFQRFWLAILSIGVIIGAGYFFVFDIATRTVQIPYGTNVEFEGVVREVRRGLDSQILVVSLNGPNEGRVRVTLGRHPAWRYGDVVLVRGTVREPFEDGFSSYLAKERVFAVTSYPEIDLIAHDGGNVVMASLFGIKKRVLTTFRHVLPVGHAALMSGLTLGDITEMTPEFRERMSVTGTTHLVALSGYNVVIIITGITFMLGYFFSRRITFWLSILTIILFILMTGADASVVRAGIMGFLVFLADHARRRYSMRNAIAVAAFFMVVVNPLLLLFDVGFQLSFAALMGLVYVQPLLRWITRASSGAGLFAWRESLFTTLSAQMTVLPILLWHFGSVSLVSLVTNVLILVFIPLTMLAGLFIAIAGLVSRLLAQIFGAVAYVFLSYEIGVIEFFARFGERFMFHSSSLLFGFVYYGVLVGGIVYYRQRITYASTV